MEVLPQSLILENRGGAKRWILLTVALFLLLFLPWLISGRELFRQEGLFAAIATEYMESSDFLTNGMSASAHHVVVDDAFPLYPMVVSQVCRLGVPMEMSLRLVAMFFLGVLSLLAGICAASRSNARAGVVAACCCFGTLFAFEKTQIGGPEAMAGCFLFAAQMLFFHYGSRLADWNSAWVAAAVLLTLGFLTAGLVVILFFAVPLVFLRRPLSSAGKFRTPGFIAGVILLLLVVVSWGLPTELALRNYAAESGFKAVELKEYLKAMLAFPAMFPVRMLPWVLVMWMPFCVALQAISPLPVFSLYLRTLFLSMLALAWLLPGVSSEQMFFIIGPLAVLTGIYYDLGIRRYGRKLRKFIACCTVLFPLLGLYVAAVYWLPEKYLHCFTTVEKLSFRNTDEHFLIVLIALGGFAILLLLLQLGVRKFPVWVNLLLMNLAVAIVGAAVLLPYRSQSREWRDFGGEVKSDLPADAEMIYKYNIQGLYSGLFYTGKPVYKIRKDDALPDKKTVYLLAPDYPDLPNRSWEPLRQDGYICRGEKVFLYKGVPVRDEFDGAGNE